MACVADVCRVVTQKLTIKIEKKRDGIKTLSGPGAWYSWLEFMGDESRRSGKAEDDAMLLDEICC